MNFKKGNNSMIRKLIHSKLLVLLVCIIILGDALFTVFLLNKNTDGFNFKLNFNTYGKDQINTYNKTFTKDLVLNGSQTIDFEFSTEVKQQILELMTKMNIMSCPDDLKVEGMGITPPCHYKLTVTIKGETKTIIWDEGFYSGMTENLPRDNVNFLKLVEFVSNNIYSMEEYKNMPEANGGYD